MSIDSDFAKEPYEPTRAEKIGACITLIGWIGAFLITLTMGLSYLLLFVFGSMYVLGLALLLDASICIGKRS